MFQMEEEYKTLKEESDKKDAEASDTMSELLDETERQKTLMSELQGHLDEQSTQVKNRELYLL